MSIHKSLHTGSGLSKHRNVLSREERLRKLADEGRWEESKNSVLGLPKVRSIKAVGKKKVKKKEEAAAPGAAESVAAPAADAKGAAKTAK
jgi:small basic protein (TIGR04137 family)